MNPFTTLRLRRTPISWRVVQYLCIAAAVLVHFCTLYVLLKEPFHFLGGDDIDRYHTIALNIVQGNGFSTLREPPFTPDGHTQPGYPLFIATIYKLFGDRQRFVQVVQVGLEFLTILMIMMICKELRLSRPLQILAVVISLCTPFLAVFSTYLLSECLATFLITVTVWAALRVLSCPSLQMWVAVGVLCGLSLQVRPDLLPVVCLISLAIICFGMRQAFHGLAFASSFILVLMPWSVRNAFIGGKFNPLANITDQTQHGYTKWLNTWLDHPRLIQQYWWNAPNITGRFPEGKMPLAERTEAELLLRSVLEGRGKLFEPPVDTAFGRLAVRARKEAPLRTLLFVPVKRLMSTWLYIPGYTYVSWPRWLTGGLFLYWATITMLFLIGVVTAIAAGHSGFVILGSVIAGRMVLPLLSAVGAEPRYMIESHPAVYICAAVGCFYTGRLFKRMSGNLGGRAKSGSDGRLKTDHI